MGSMFRSEEMALCQLFMQVEGAYACVSELGELGVVQFRDLNPDINIFQRKFVNEVRRCDEMERKLRFLEKEMITDKITMLDTEENPEVPQPREMIDLEATIEKMESDLKEVNGNAVTMKKNFLELTEMKHILRKAEIFFNECEENASDFRMEASRNSLVSRDILQGQQPSMQLGFVAGVILREKMAAFELMLWRACHGNVFLRQADIEIPLEDPVKGNDVHKSVFIIFFQGDLLKTKVKKICEGFRATLYPCPETHTERKEMALKIKNSIDDLNSVLSQTQAHRHRVLASAAKSIKMWIIKVQKMKAIYHTLNMFNVDVTQKCLIAECWCSVDDLEKIQLALRKGTERSGSTLPPILNRMETNIEPPTYNRTSKYTEGFQTIIEAYGVADYREVNPALYTIVTFPFLFAVMFGDAGHGLLMTLFALWMVLFEKRLAPKKNENNEIWEMFFGGRYLILLMGFFSMYTGLIYNDVFSKSVNIFGSSWYAPYNDSFLIDKETFGLQPEFKDVYSGTPYPFGIDPVWQVSKNKLNFLNSYKMKISIIIGVIHMLFGVSLSFVNHRYFRKAINIFCEFIPQVLFMCSIFGYLVILIFYKWVAYDAAHSKCAPSLLIHLINMFLAKYDAENCTQKMFYTGQQPLQIFFVALALICIPWMLLVKPFIIRRDHLRKTRQLPVIRQAQAVPYMHSNGNPVEQTQSTTVVIESNHVEPSGEDSCIQDDNEDGSEEFNFQEIFIIQCIHTIEYCLGCISNTASYLRLWALSLAHAQLSEVLWTMIMQIPLQMDLWFGGVILYFIFAVWAVLTVFILLVMEGLSAFLHALRLHWVEFCNKFYKGTGYLFVPFSFDTVLATYTPTEDKS